VESTNISLSIAIGERLCPAAPALPSIGPVYRGEIRRGPGFHGEAQAGASPIRVGGPACEGFVIGFLFAGP
jgi:hypothetical protein